MANITEEFRFALLSLPPYSSPCANRTSLTVGRTLHCPQPGVYYELFQTYTQAMGVKANILWATASQVGSYENGVWTGILGMIANGTLATIGASYEYTDLRDEYFDFSFSTYDIQLVYMVKEVKSSALDAILDIFSPFDVNVWMLCFATIFALLIAYFFINVNVERNLGGGRSKSVGLHFDSAWNYYRYLVNSCGRDVRLNSYSGIILFISGGIFPLVMMNLYGGVLVSQLLGDYYYSPLSSADSVLSLIEQKKYKMIFDRSYSSFWYYQEAVTSNDTHYVQLRKALAKNPYAYADNATQAMQMVLRGGYILPKMSDSSTIYNAFNQCDVTLVSPTDFPSRLATFMFRNGSPFKKRFNDAVYSTQKLTDRIWNLYFGDVAAQKRANNCKQPNIMRPLSIDACLGIFVVLFIGFLLAATIFIGEVARKSFNQKMYDTSEEFRYALLNMEPYAFACANDTPLAVGRTLQCPQPGSYYELFQIYVQAMGVTPKLLWANAEDLGNYESGSWTGIYEMIANGTLDTVAVSHQYTNLRKEYFDFSFAYHEIKLMYMVKEVKLSAFEAILDIFVPFNYDVWLLSIATILTLLIAHYFVNICGANHIEKASSKPASLDADSVWEYFRYLIYSCGRDVRPKYYSGILLFICGGIFALIMMNLYGGVLLSQILVDRYHNPFSTAEGVLKLIEQKKYKLIFDQTNPSFWYYQEAQVSNQSHFVQLRKALSKNPYAYADNVTHMMNMVRSGGYILPKNSDNAVIYQAINDCDITFVSPEGFPSQFVAFMFRNKSPIIKRFNDAVYSTQKLADQIWDKYYGEAAAENRANHCKRSNPVRPLSIGACLGFFLVLVVGFLLAATTLIGEVVKQKLADKMFKEQIVDFIDLNFSSI